jgi:hypothetical protein
VVGDGARAPTDRRGANRHRDAAYDPTRDDGPAAWCAPAARRLALPPAGMGALLVYFVIGSVLSVPVLGYQLLPHRRELSELRAELRQRGLIAPAPARRRCPRRRPATGCAERVAAPAAALVASSRAAEPPRPSDGRAG